MVTMPSLAEVSIMPFSWWVFFSNHRPNCGGADENLKRRYPAAWSPLRSIKRWETIAQAGSQLGTNWF